MATFGSGILWTRKVNVTGSWVLSEDSTYLAPASFALVALAGNQRFRFGWTVASVSEGDILSNADLDIEYSLMPPSGGGWQETGMSAKNVSPGYSTTIGGIPVVIRPQYVVRQYAIPDEWTGYDVRLRLRVVSIFGTNYSPILTMTVRPQENGVLDEFPETLDAAVFSWNERRVGGVFEKQFRETLGVEGRQPSFLCDRTLVEEFEQGEIVDIEGEPTYEIARKKYDSAGLVRLQFAEAA